MDERWHDSYGRFRAGNPGSVVGCSGWARKSKELREAMMATVTVEDVEVITRNLVQQAKKGDPWAIHEFYDRVIGRVKIMDEDSESDRYKEIPQPVLDKVLAEAGYVRIASAGSGSVSPGT